MHHTQATDTPVILHSGWARPNKIHAKSRVYKAIASNQKSRATTEKVIHRLKQGECAYWSLLALASQPFVDSVVANATHINSTSS